MDVKKLLKRVEENKDKQVEKYEKCIKNFLRKYKKN